MPATDDLLRTLWACVERAGDLDRELRATADELAAWRVVASAACAALDHAIARSSESDATENDRAAEKEIGC